MSATSSAPHPARRSSWGSLFLWLLIIGASAAGLRNALAIEPELEGQARAVACAASASPAQPAASASPARPAASAPLGGKPAPSASSCALQTRQWEAGPLGRAFGFDEPGTGARLRVQCRREYIALGDYQCVKAP